MPLPTAHKYRLVYHFTHLDNLANALKGGLLSYNQQESLGITHHSIADSDIQKRRAEMEVPLGPGGVVHDYVPLYFTKLSPMLLAIVKCKNVDQSLLIHFAFPISLIGQPGVVFTDRAANGNTPPGFYMAPSDLDALDWAAIDSTKWHTPDRDKQPRMAEVLVRDRLDPRLATRIYAWNDDHEKDIREIYKKVGIACPQVCFHGPGDSHCFVNFAPDLPDDMKGLSIAPGPRETKELFEEAVKEVLKEGGKAAKPKFATLNDLLGALQTHGLSATAETRELVGLETQNEVHKDDVGTHTLKVVSLLRASSEFKELKTSDRMLAELAAYLHDIGKGPKSRWSKSEGKQLPDAYHPLRSLKMLVRLLVEDLGPVKPRHVKALCMLACYHDLIGDVVGKGRKKVQLMDAIESERDLDMLIALGKADLSAVASGWGAKALSKIPEIREWCLEEIADE